MIHPRLFAFLLQSTYTASGTTEPMERYYASMFASFYARSDSQPSCAAVKAIALGKHTVPRKLLCHYRDTDQPRCPRKLKEDLAALADCCFVDAIRRHALRRALEAFVQMIPAADAQDLCRTMGNDNLNLMWTCLTWYALCGDCHGTTSY